MKLVRKCICLMLCFSLSAYTLPVVAAVSLQSDKAVQVELTDEEMAMAVGAGNVDATLSEYVRFDPNVPPVAEAVVSNRSLLTVPYALEVIDLQGTVLESLASGTLAPGETKIIQGSATVVNRSVVRVTVGGADSGLRAVDTTYLYTRQ